MNRTSGERAGSINGVRFTRVTATESANGMLISSRTGIPIRGVEIVNSSLTMVPPPPARQGVAYLDAWTRDYRPTSMMADKEDGRPMSVLRLEHVEGAVMRGVTLAFDAPTRSSRPSWWAAPTDCLSGTPDSMASLHAIGLECHDFPAHGKTSFPAPARSGHYATSTAATAASIDWSVVRHELEHVLATTPGLNEPTIAPTVLRLAWHAASTFDPHAQPHGGSSGGATMRFEPEARYHPSFP